MRAPLDGWKPGVRIIWQGKSGQIIKRSPTEPSQVWVKLDDEKLMQNVRKSELRGEGTA